MTTLHEVADQGIIAARIWERADIWDRAGHNVRRDLTVRRRGRQHGQFFRENRHNLLNVDGNPYGC